MTSDISQFLNFEIKKELADRYFGFRKLIEEDKALLEKDIYHHTRTVGQRIVYDLNRIYIMLQDEELIRRFNEENNEEAGEHFTPRDVVKLMAKLLFLPIADRIESGTYLVYDGACGTGGMLTVAEERLAELATAHGKDVSIHLYGQEINPETYAITKADLLLKGKGQEADALALPGARRMEMGARTMPGMVEALPEAMADDAVRARLLALAIGFAGALPAK